MTSVLAIDVGGTKLSCGEVSASGSLLRHDQVQTSKSGSGEDLFETLWDLVLRFAPFDSYLACGIGSAGPMAAGGAEISPINIRQWRKFPLTARIQAATGLPTSLTNDVKALAIGEAWRGAAKGVDNFMAMVVSTGIGGGIVLNGRLLDGRLGNAGHIGHVIVDSPGRKLAHHITGSLEAEASGLAIASHTGNAPEEAANSVIEESARFVGQAAGSAMNLLDMDLVVVAGGVALGYGDLFFEVAQAEVDRICQLDFTRGAKIIPAGCGTAGPLIGAGGVGFRHIGNFVGGIS